MIYVAYVFMILGCFFAFAGTVGVLRMPDAYCRMQSSTNIATLGTLGALLGGFIFALTLKNTSMALKILFIAVFIIITNPVAGHAICKAAYKSGVKAEKLTCDDYGRDFPNE
ncbi:MAG: monovalent cation/H(+) antiporter subunit G [Caloramator sp.]|nr:monovalent cation/H(+) antiporter subunit G [Caloramator sp.]